MEVERQTNRALREAYELQVIQAQNEAARKTNPPRPPLNQNGWILYFGGFACVLLIWLALTSPIVRGSEIWDALTRGPTDDQSSWRIIGILVLILLGTAYYLARAVTWVVRQFLRIRGAMPQWLSGFGWFGMWFAITQALTSPTFAGWVVLGVLAAFVVLHEVIWICDDRKRWTAGTIVLKIIFCGYVGLMVYGVFKSDG